MGVVRNERRRKTRNKVIGIGAGMTAWTRSSIVTSGAADVMRTFWLVVYADAAGSESSYNSGLMWRVTTSPNSVWALAS
jgi:hypothetical protein